MALRITNLFHLTMVLLLLTACTGNKNEKNISDLPIILSYPGQTGVNVDVMVENAQKEITTQATSRKHINAEPDALGAGDRL